MSLQLVNAINGNTPDEEYIILKATTDMNLQGHALVDRTFKNTGALSNEFRHIFVSPHLNVKKGAFIRVYSGEGSYKTEPLKDKATRHLLHWGAKSCVWNDKGGDIVLLITYQVVQQIPVPNVE